MPIYKKEEEKQKLNLAKIIPAKQSQEKGGKKETGGEESDWDFIRNQVKAEF